MNRAKKEIIKKINDYDKKTLCVLFSKIEIDKRAVNCVEINDNPIKFAAVAALDRIRFATNIRYSYASKHYSRGYKIEKKIIIVPTNEYYKDESCFVPVVKKVIVNDKFADLIFKQYVKNSMERFRYFYPGQSIIVKHLLDSELSKKKYLYIIKHPNYNICKIGETDDIDRRLPELRRKYNFKNEELICVIKFASKFEDDIHKIFDNYNLKYQHNKNQLPRDAHSINWGVEWFLYDTPVVEKFALELSNAFSPIDYLECFVNVNK